MKLKAKIMKKLGIVPLTPINFRILIASLRTILHYDMNAEADLQQTWDAPVLDNFKELNSDELRYIISEIPEEDMSIEKCQTIVQKQIPHGIRKRYAAYYSLKDAIDYMTSIICNYLNTHRKRKIVLADPFLGSARTLTNTARRIGADRISKIWGIELLPLPALVGYASLLKAVEGKRELVMVKLGDAFREIPASSSLRKSMEFPRSDVVTTNPPFTRWKYLEKEYRCYLIDKLSDLGYSDFISKGEVSLQVLSMFLVDYFLNDNGLLVSVLPASTFYTIYGKGYRNFLKEKYSVLQIVSCASRSSFSEDSGFKEVILSCIKGTSQNGPTLFGRIGTEAGESTKTPLQGTSNEDFNPVSIHQLPRFLDFNWLSLLERSELRDLVVSIFQQGLKNGTMGYWDDVIGRENIVRGVEMYGPDFFFIPNRYWRILRDDQYSIEIENRDEENGLTMDKAFFVRTLRKPSLYSDTIEANLSSYMISIPPNEANHLPKDLEAYIRWGKESGTADPSVRAYGKYWYSHVYRQMISKKPYGRIFVPDKVDLSFAKRSVFANYTEERVAASKNFFIIKDEDSRIIKPLVGWFNSTIFISALVLLGRRISDRWTRLLESDYLELPVINVRPKTVRFYDTSNGINKILNKRIPPLWNQLGEKYRYELDLSLIKAMKVEQPERVIGTLYEVLKSCGYGSP
ncbi:MAG: Eco57I restriction-modification methylase domain-containing protein [Promethearchaeota archaeon]